MSYNVVVLNLGVGGQSIAVDRISGSDFQRVKLVTGAEGAATDVSSSNPMPVTGRLQGVDAHDAVITADPLLIGGRASAAAPTDVSADGDAVRPWFLRSGAAAVVLTAAGALLGGDATNGLDVDVTRVSGTVTIQGGAATDAAVTGNPLLTGARASNAVPSSVSADGDAVPVRADRAGHVMVRLVDGAGDSVADDANDAIRVNVVAGAAGGVSATDDAAFTVGSGSVVPVAGIYRSTRDSVDDNDTGALAMNQKRGLYVSLETPNSDSLVDDTSDAVKMIGPIAHDAANAANHNPLLLGARAADSALAAVNADGDAVILRADRLGQLGVRVFDSTGDSCADDANNSLRVSIVAGAGSGGTSMTDDAAFTVGTSGVTPAAGIYRSARDLVDDNDAGALAMTQRRALLVALETPNGDSMADDTNDAVRVAIVTASGAVTISPNEAQSNANITANGQTVASQTGGYGGSSFEITGTWTGTIEFEGRSVQGWTAILAYPAGTSNKPVTNTTGNGTWQVNSGGLDQIRLRSSAWTSGTAVCTIARTTADFDRPHKTARLTDDSDVSCMNSVSHAVRASLVGTDDNYITGDTSNGLDVDVTRVTPGTAAANLGKAEDAAHTSGDVGVMALAVRRDTVASSSGTDGDYSTLNVNASGRLYTSATIDAAIPAGTNNIGDVDVLTLPGSIGADAHDAAVTANPVLMGGRASAAAPTDVSADGDVTRIWVLRSGAQATVLTAAGALIGGDATNGLDVDVTRVTGTVTTQDTASLVDNAGFTDGTSRVLPVGYIFDETAGTALTENDVAAGRIDSKRAQVSVLEDATTRGQRVAVNAGGALEVHGDAAHDAAVAGNPVLVGLEARTTDGTAVGSGDAVRGLADTLGKQVVLVGAVHDLQVRGTANYTNTTASDLVAAAGAGVRIAVMGVIVTNAHATVSTKVEVRDGTTVRIQGYAAAAGGGFVASGGGVPLFISTANTAVTGRNVTTGADTDITVWGYKIGN